MNKIISEYKVCIYIIKLFPYSKQNFCCQLRLSLQINFTKLFNNVNLTIILNLQCPTDTEMI